MSVIHIEANVESGQVRHLVRAAIDGEIAKLQLALQLARKRLQSFEEKYGVTSAQLKMSCSKWQRISNGHYDRINNFTPILCIESTRK